MAVTIVKGSTQKDSSIEVPSVDEVYQSPMTLDGDFSVVVEPTAPVPKATRPRKKAKSASTQESTAPDSSPAPKKRRRSKVLPNGAHPKHKLDYIASKIPGIEPVKVLKNGSCVYSEEQLASVREQLPEPEITGTERDAQYAIREKQVAQVELMLLKGVTNQNIIAGILQCSRQHIAGLVKAVHTRWEVLGGPRNASRVKGEASSKLSLIENEYWSLFQKESTPASSKITILSNILQLIDRRLLLQGLSPRVLEAIAIDKAGENDDVSAHPMNQSLTVQDSLANATREALQLIAQASGDHQHV